MACMFELSMWFCLAQTGGARRSLGSLEKKETHKTHEMHKIEWDLRVSRKLFHWRFNPLEHPPRTHIEKHSQATTSDGVDPAPGQSPLYRCRQ